LAFISSFFLALGILFLPCLLKRDFPPQSPLKEQQNKSWFKWKWRSHFIGTVLRWQGNRGIPAYSFVVLAEGYRKVYGDTVESN
jgi:hypothetical protein